MRSLLESGDEEIDSSKNIQWQDVRQKESVILTNRSDTKVIYFLFASGVLRKGSISVDLKSSTQFHFQYILSLKKISNRIYRKNF